MIAPSNHEFGLRNSGSEEIESFDHQLKAFVCSPFSKRQNPMLGIAAP